jgi:hypothetical protein
MRLVRADAAVVTEPTGWVGLSDAVDVTRVLVEPARRVCA